MTRTWQLTVRLVPPPAGEPAGPVTRVGAASLAMMQLGGLPLEFGRYSADAETLTLELVVLDSARSAADVQAVARTAGIALMESAPELADWQFLVEVGPGPETDPGRPEPQAAEEPEELDENYEASIYAAARLLRGLPIDRLTSEDLGTVSGAGRGAALRRGEALAGCLIQAADLMIDQLFDDLHVLEAAQDDALDNGDGLRVEVDLDGLTQVGGLPQRYREHYTADFLRSFIVAATDLTSRLTGTWSEPACLAQDLAFWRLLDTAEQIAAAVRLDLPPQWHERLRSTLTRKDDVAKLFQEDEAAEEGVALEAWFRPYSPEQTLPPYVLPYPTD